MLLQMVGVLPWEEDDSGQTSPPAAYVGFRLYDYWPQTGNFTGNHAGWAEIVWKLECVQTVCCALLWWSVTVESL